MFSSIPGQRVHQRLLFQTKVDTRTIALLVILFGVAAPAPVTNISCTAYTSFFLPTTLTELSVLMTESMCIISFILC